MNKTLHKAALHLTIAAQLFTGLIGTAQAAPVAVGTINLPVQTQLIDSNSPWAQRMALSLGDARFVRNQSGAVVLDIPAGEAADLIYSKVGSTPQIWAAYSPGSATGRIQVVKALKRGADHGQVTLYVYDFSPKVMGPAVVRDGYHHVDPYLDFVSASDDMWHNIDQSAFLAAVGKAMLKNRTAISYVALANVHQEKAESSSGGLFTTSSTTTVSTYVSPRWIFGTSVENGGPQAFAAQYVINPARCTPALDARNCVVQGGVNFVYMSGGNLNEQEYLADQQSQTTSSWTMLAQLVFTCLVAYAGGLAMGLNGVSATTATFGGGAGGSLGAAQVAGIAGASYGGLNLAINGGSLTSAQGSWFGSVTNGIAAPTPGGFGDPSQAIHGNFVAPGVAGNLQGGQLEEWRRNQPKTWSDRHDPAYMQANPPTRSGVMNGYVNSPIIR